LRHSAIVGISGTSVTSRWGDFLAADILYYETTRGDDVVTAKHTL